MNDGHYIIPLSPTVTVTTPMKFIAVTCNWKVNIHHHKTVYALINSRTKSN